VSNEKQHDEHDEDAIEGKSLVGSFRIPADRGDIGPHIKWVIISAAVSLLIIATAFAWSLVK
jgi:hypothetical protein